jgi:hypothetical protein
MSLYVYQSHALTAIITPEGLNAEVIWTSSDPSIATVDSTGLVTAIAEGTATITASAADIEPSVCEVTVSPIPSSFPRKFLLEHFTGETCGNCPNGMANIVQHINKATIPYIWVSHHYGYGDDEYTIKESAKIGKKLGVNGAPYVALNRTKLQGQFIAFPPDYLNYEGMDQTIADKFEPEAEASVVINHSYNATNNELSVTVSGFVGDTTITEYLLTILIKENGLIGKQADYALSWQVSGKTCGYMEYQHPRIVRDVLVSDALGDTLEIVNQMYSKTYTYTIPVSWVAENCCIVAYITPLAARPIINAEQQPLIPGTTGGEEYLPYGITDLQAPTYATSLTFDSAKINKPSAEKLELTLITSTATRSETYGPVIMVAEVDINTTNEQLKEGVYNISDSNEPNTVSIGTTDPKTQSFGGSYLSYVTKASIETDNWQHTNFWRMKTGSMTVNTDGSIIIEGKLFNGKNFKATYTPAE